MSVEDASDVAAVGIADNTVVEVAIEDYDIYISRTKIFNILYYL